MSTLTRITASTLKMGSEFKSFLRYMFDDPEEIGNEYAKHSSCRVQLMATIDESVALELIESFNLSLSKEDLIGNWMIESLSDYNWGIEWDLVDEVVKVHKVTETITVTKWKPIQNETVLTCCSK